MKNHNAVDRGNSSTTIRLHDCCFSHGYAILFFPANAIGKLLRTDKKSAIFHDSLVS